jgi:hypothetical protein
MDRQRKRALGQSDQGQWAESGISALELLRAAICDTLRRPHFHPHPIVNPAAARSTGNRRDIQ